MSWLFALIGLALGGLAGYLLARRFGDSELRAANLEKELERARDEHANYRREVSEHFAKTATAVNQLTDSYRNVHQQLSEGARALCDNAAAETVLAFDQARLIDAPAEPPTAGPAGDAADSAPTPEPADPASASEPDEHVTTGTDADAPLSQEDAAAPPAPEDVTADAAPGQGGASWTPAGTGEDDAPVTPPRDYADEPGDTTRPAS